MFLPFVLKEELDRHLNLLPRCRERNPDEAVLSFLDSLSLGGIGRRVKVSRWGLHALTLYR